eukprot:1173341-Rhodomonas_salina.1
MSCKCVVLACLIPGIGRSLSAERSVSSVLAAGLGGGWEDWAGKGAGRGLGEGSEPKTKCSPRRRELSMSWIVPETSTCGRIEEMQGKRELLEEGRRDGEG